MAWRFWTLSRSAYWGLMDPGTPWNHLVNVALRPCFTVLTFGYLVSTVAEGDTLRGAVFGASVLALNWPLLGGALRTVGYELENGTLGITIASPVSRVRLLASRGLLHIPNGLIAPVFAIAVGAAVFRLDLGGVDWAGVVGSLVIVALSLTALGLFLGVLSLVVREVWALQGVASTTLYALSGAIVPLDTLHPAAEGFASVVPGRWGIEALHRSLAGSGWAGITGDWARELAVAATCFAAAVAALHLYEAGARRRGSVDLV
jgi:ABC-type multidrug transport system permease subunit